MKKILKKTIPWLLCVLVFYYIFKQVPPEQAWSVLKYANVPLFIFVSLAYFFVIHVLDCLTIKHFITRFAAPISHKESWIARGVSYLVMIINYYAAQGGFAFFFKKTHNVPVAKTLGILSFISLMDLVLIFTSSFIAVCFKDVVYSGVDFRILVFAVTPLVFGLYFLWIVFWRNSNKPLIKGWEKYKIVRWLLQHDVFLIFREAKFIDYLILLFYRIPITFCVIGGFNLALWSFQATLSWTDIYLYNPLVLFMAALPITPAGLGTGPMLYIELYKNLIQSPLIVSGTLSAKSLLLTSSLLWFAGNQIIKMLFAMGCLTQTSRKMFK